METVLYLQDLQYLLGKVVSNEQYTKGDGGLIGFNSNNILVLDSSFNKKNIRDGVSFGPFLIINGKASSGGDSSRAPRTAIGQRSDGKILFLVLDGNRNLGRGATYKDVIEIMQKYGAINAANLDGGTSSNLVINNQLINDPIDGSGRHATRPIATGIGLFL